MYISKLAAQFITIWLWVITSQKLRTCAEAAESDGLSKGTVNIGHNQNKGGKQKLGNVRIGNRAAGSELGSSPVTIPENINAGYNTNEGGDQETGDIEIGNVG